eukprot:scaffold1014_cov260-Pinguiococcus_pyrenoidosus.AAC.2
MARSCCGRCLRIPSFPPRAVLSFSGVASDNVPESQIRGHRGSCLPHGQEPGLQPRGDRVDLLQVLLVHNRRTGSEEVLNGGHSMGGGWELLQEVVQLLDREVILVLAAFRHRPKGAQDRQLGLQVAGVLERGQEVSGGPRVPLRSPGGMPLDGSGEVHAVSGIRRPHVVPDDGVHLGIRLHLVDDRVVGHKLHLAGVVILWIALGIEPRTRRRRRGRIGVGKPAEGSRRVTAIEEEDGVRVAGADLELRRAVADVFLDRPLRVAVPAEGAGHDAEEEADDNHHDQDRELKLAIVVIVVIVRRGAWHVARSLGGRDESIEQRRWRICTAKGAQRSAVPLSASPLSSLPLAACSL